MPACQLRVLTLPNYRCLHSKLCQLTCYIRIKTKEADNLAVSSTGTKYQCRLDRRLSAVSPGDSGASRHHVFPSNAFATHLHTIQATCHTIRYNLHGSNGGFQNANINSHWTTNNLRAVPHRHAICQLFRIFQTAARIICHSSALELADSDMKIQDFT